MNVLFRFVFLLFFSVSLFAVPPAPGKIINKGMPKDSVKRIYSINEMKAMGYSPDKIQKALSTTLGTIKLAVVFVDFDDVKFNENGGTGGSILPYVSRLNIATGTKIVTETGLLKDLMNYIAECSYGKMTLEVYPFTGPLGKGYNLSGSTVSTYGKTITIGGNIIEEAGVVSGELFRDSIAKVTSTSAFTITNATYNALMVVHAGIGEESPTGVTDDDIWSVFVEWDPSFGSAGGFFEGETVPAMESTGYYPFGVLCHEFGHQLGLPDLYQTIAPKNSRVGKWDLMDYGSWVNNGANPPHMSSWNKILINWMIPTVQSSSTTLTINSFESSSGNCFKIPILSSTTEYFLFEYRRQAGFDSNLPGEGVLVWHIDDSIGSLANNDINNGTIYRVALEEKDDDSDVGFTSRGESTDPFDGAGDLFTSPQSDSYSDGPSKITLSNFSGSGTAVMTAKLFAIPATTNIVFNKMFNYPNPVKNAASSTIRAVFSRNVTATALRIYTIAGELVMEAALAQNDSVSAANNEWIYEYNWDLKNSDGRAAASGIYVYVISAQVNSQSQTKTGKIAIIR
ncbi:MAG: hypothetical protein A2452_03570 [Candidatus Firestonebacteria bacterium RIFOXYC2_FULL_39_67]|nr:MAG: hypothetical protein A2536_00545 [Candidatus Firestonebacteria bacterium RIFOXYD2_FULL_39_29]OGF57155.1 MAG: hypothetical protein A2452_03570 [Candidatus Firestonebacteria bacterium RIFOXYC2_FULL_39_67]